MLSRAYRVLNQLTVNSAALLHNYSYFSKLNPQAQIALVLKANAYGHGLTTIANFCANLPQVPMICVDSLYEAYELYKQGITKPILIMGYTVPANYQIWKRLPFIFTVFDSATALALNKYQPGARVHLKLDTGLTRLGATSTALPQLLKTLQSCTSLQIEGVFSHLACADNPAKSTVTKTQLRRFKAMTTLIENTGYRPRFKHIAATAGAVTLHDPYFNLIRLGLGFYGYSPFGPHTKEGRGLRENLQPALSLSSQVALIKTIDKGTTVGYGAAYTARQKETVAILPLGYNEGINRELSNQGYFLLKNRIHCPIIGRISMNMTAIKVPRGVRIRVGDTVTFMPVYQAANLEKTIPYTVLTGLNPSIRRTLI